MSTPEEGSVAEIHLSYVNGQHKQMVKLIDLYGVHDFWKDLKGYLDDYFPQGDNPVEVGRSLSVRYNHYSDIANSYQRIKGCQALKEVIPTDAHKEVLDELTHELGYCIEKRTKAEGDLAETKHHYHKALDLLDRINKNYDEYQEIVLGDGLADEPECGIHHEDMLASLLSEIPNIKKGIAPIKREIPNHDLMYEPEGDV